VYVKNNKLCIIGIISHICVLHKHFYKNVGYEHWTYIYIVSKDVGTDYCRYSITLLYIFNSPASR